MNRFGPLLGGSAAMMDLFARLDRIAGGDGTVLIEGETGTGKELVARAVHASSSRARGPFVIVDCGALPETLLDAELFGHAKGAFTGATGARPGAFESSHGGTLFLDEVGELPLALQPRLLRVIEARTIRRLGENRAREIDVRYIAATHRDLRAMVAGGAFRQDLYFRLAVLPVSVPALRERVADILPLASYFLGPDAQGMVSPRLACELTAYHWPGNVRQLRNFVERLATFGPSEALALTAADHHRPRPHAAAALPEGGGSVMSMAEERARWTLEFERRYIRDLLDRHGHNVTAAARTAGVHRSHIHRLMQRHRLDAAAREAATATGTGPAIAGPGGAPGDRRD